MAISQEINVENLYRVFGRYNNVATFVFKVGSTAFEAYGPYVTGSIRYRPSDRSKLQKALEEGIQSGLPQGIKLGYVFPGDDRKISLLLRKEGFKCDDVEECQFVSWKSEDKFAKKEARELPNVIKIKVDTSQFLPGAEDNITLHRYESTLHAGWEFIDEEKFEFIGIYAALSRGSFPKEYLEKLNVKEEDIRLEDREWMYFYEAKAKRAELSDEENFHLQTIKTNRMQERLLILASEIEESFGDIRKSKIEPDKLKIILNAIFNFKDERVLYIECPIYWDFVTYAHVYLRHVKESQLGGNFEKKSVFLYKQEDIKDLMRRVLETISTDIKEHYSIFPRKRFTRHGDGAVEFNGDYYTIDISDKGRIENFFCSA